MANPTFSLSHHERVHSFPREKNVQLAGSLHKALMFRTGLIKVKSVLNHDAVNDNTRFYWIFSPSNLVALYVYTVAVSGT